MGHLQTAKVHKFQFKILERLPTPTVNLNFWSPGFYLWVYRPIQKYWPRNVDKRGICNAIGMSVRLSVRDIHESRLNGSRYRNTVSHRTIQRCFLVCWPRIAIINSGVQFTPNECIKQRHPLLTPKTWSATSSKRCKIGCKLLLFTHRKSHTGFRLVPKVVTLNNLDRCKGRYFALFYRIR